ncbi:short-chain dehydrogenase [Jannaschia sp. EhC01]|uniref:SDR family oxidoreductase n=1 Tax=Gymnodinialimonas phycosphaerae TaxID=2841589 RepID=A0A975TTH3_9RHOB|nr:SDR family oxidoreductase [Gymnodinialimonas phycosphaerae]MBY4894467.1 SDR family oxidoreductase [Gymnodinialimonas phycosphaerae]OAN78973.1 short-chain dehydrogenase [Jannaschia sp. EhC01]
MAHVVEGKVVAITGASRGIGAAAAREFASLGAKVVLLARSRDAIAELTGEIGENALAVPCDVARYWEVEAAFRAAVETFGALDVVINNAGVIEPVARIEDTDPGAWGQVIDINLKGTFNGIRAALPHMTQGGTIIGISSGAATNPLEGWSHYCASKAAALMLTRSLHKEMGDRGIRALGLSPGTVATQMQVEIKATGMNPVAQLEWSDHIPPEWPAKTLAWMCTEAADPYLGGDISLRDEAIRAAVGLA